MKRIDFENGNIVSNILKAALPMLVAQIMSLLYGSRRCWTLFPDHRHYHSLQQPVRHRRCADLLH